ncbi:hypothetical protein PR048_027797 [Dryococelus australis]|uniref:Cytochrome P450 n=1 Tax=Dryococelus australis TaxID=614101 RepID=A0ABQ9GHI6_9NEOP|nr:hypothetical protein PR048_027797 [Dryococelus australis]
MERALKISQPFEKIIKIWLGPKLIVFLIDPDDVESALTESRVLQVILSSHVHLDKSPEYRMFQPWFGNGLLISSGKSNASNVLYANGLLGVLTQDLVTRRSQRSPGNIHIACNHHHPLTRLWCSSGETWRAHRKLIAPAFHLNVLKSFLGQLNANSKILVERLRKEQLSGKPFDVHEYAAEITVDMLLETVMGVNRKGQDASTFDYAMAVMRLCDIIHQRTIKIWYQIKSINSVLGFGKEEGKLLELIHDLSGKILWAGSGDVCEFIFCIPRTLFLRSYLFPERPATMDHRKMLATTIIKQHQHVLVLQHSVSQVFKTKKEEYLKNKLSGATKKIIDDSDTSETFTKGTYFDQTRGLKDDLDDDVGKKLTNSRYPIKLTYLLQCVSEHCINTVSQHSGEKKRLPFLELLIDTNQNGGQISEEEIKNQVDTIMFELNSAVLIPQGHDTVAAGSSFIMCTLGAHSEVQEKVVQELYEIFGDSDRPATFNDTLQMKYLERVILETLRMFPPVPVIARNIKQEVKLRTYAGALVTCCPVAQTCSKGDITRYRIPVSHPSRTDAARGDPSPALSRRDDRGEDSSSARKRVNLVASEGLGDEAEWHGTCAIAAVVHQGATSGYTLPIGSTCVIATYKMHRLADVYPNPEVFNPDNFLPENTNNRHYYAFIPFSAGPRSCVGRKYAMLKLKVMISTVLRNYKIVSEVPQEVFKLQADIILKRSDGFRIRLEPRGTMARS